MAGVPMLGRKQSTGLDRDTVGSPPATLGIQRQLSPGCRESATVADKFPHYSG